MATAQEIGTTLVTLCQAGKAEDAVTQLYAPNIVSIEGPGSDPSMARMEGLAAIQQKNAWWFANHDVHAMTATGPYVGHRDDQFLVRFAIDMTPTGGQRRQMDEVGLYTVKNGTIVQEEFMYLMG